MKSHSSDLTDFSTGSWTVHLWAGFPIGSPVPRPRSLGTGLPIGVLHNSGMSMALEVEGSIYLCVQY